MIEALPSALQTKVSELAAELGLSVEEFIVQTVAKRVETVEFFKSRAASTSAGSLAGFLDAAPDVSPFPGDEIPEDLIEKLEALKLSMKSNS